MDIICPQCSTEYEFEDEKVTESGVTVKCASCAYTFKVRRRQVVETEPVVEEAAPPEPPPPPSGDKLWMVRASSGELYRFKELPTLQQWIVERKVSREDEISRSGDTWKRLGDIAELTSFFQVVDAAVGSGPAGAAASIGAGASPHDTAGPVTVGPMAIVTDDEKSMDMAMGAGVGGEDEPAFAASSGASFRTVGPQAAWEGGGRRVSAAHQNGHLDELPRRKPGKMIGLIILGLIILGLGGFAALKPKAVKGFFSGLFGDSEEVSEAYRRARELFLKDGEKNLSQADLEFTKAPKESLIAQAGRLEVATTWAQYMLSHAELLERQARQLDAQAAAIQPPEPPRKGKKTKEKEPAAPPPEKVRLIEGAKALRLRASKLRAEAQQKVKASGAAAETLLARAQNRAEVLRAVADLRRLQGQRGKMVLGLLRKALQSKPDDPETFYVEGVYWAGLGNQAKGVDLLKEAMIKTRAYTKQTLLRAAFQLAMLHLRGGRRAEGKRLVAAILAANPSHSWARALGEQLAREDKDSLGGANTGATASTGATSGAGATANTGTTNAGTTNADTGTADTGTGDKPSTGKPSGSKRKAAIPFGGSYSALVRAGDKLAERGRTMQALSAYEAALKKNSRGVEALTGLAYCQLDIQRYSVAISRFRKAMNISPTYGEAMVGMAEAYKAMGNKAKSLDYYKAYLRAHPNGKKASLARRNAKTLERALGRTPAPAPAPSPGDTAPAPPAPGSTPAPAPSPAPAPAPQPSSPSSSAHQGLSACAQA